MNKRILSIGVLVILVLSALAVYAVKTINDDLVVKGNLKLENGNLRIHKFTSSTGNWGAEIASNYGGGITITPAAIDYGVASNSADRTVKIDFSADFYIKKLAGTGNAYACLNAQGKLYRSQTRCV